jgi:nicotinate phosphoribosyltransferase
MSFPTEEEAFIAWDRIFPGTTFLIDTYNVVNAAKLIKRLILEGKITKPKDLRIDSDPIEEYAFEIRKIFDEMGIYLSGDMEPKKFKHFEFLGVPYAKAMAGTKYCYSSMIVEKLNCGFVYKLVQFKKDGKFINPEKKANGKLNYSGLKNCIFDEATNTLIVDCINSNKKIGFRNFDKILPTTTVKFIQI